MEKEASFKKKSRANIIKATSLVFLVTIFSRILGFVRDALIANNFGASDLTDAYLVAYNLPYALESVLGMTFATVMVPVLTSYFVRQDEQRGWEIASSSLNWIAVILFLVTVLAFIFTPQLVMILAPGFSAELTALTINLMRIMLPGIIFLGLGMVFTSILNARFVFTLPAFAPALSNIVIIIALFTLAQQYQIIGLAYGTLLGFILMMLIQIPALKGVGFKFYRSWEKSKEIKSIFRDMMPAFLAVALNQVYLMLNRIFASALAAGSITALDFGNRIMSLPGIMVAAIWTTSFPLFSERAAEKDMEGFRRVLSDTLRAAAFLIIPAAVGLALLARPVTTLFFQRGAFDLNATYATASALAIFCIGLPALDLSVILNRAFYALGDFRLPLIYGYIGIGLNIILSLILMPVMGHTGLALANSLALIVNMFLLVIKLSQKHVLEGREFTYFLGKLLFLSLAMGVVVGVTGYFLTGYLEEGFFLLSVKVIILVVIGALSYAFLSWISGIREAKAIASSILAHLPSNLRLRK